MSLPNRPGASPTQEQQRSFRHSTSRRPAPADVEAGSRGHSRVKSGNSFAETIPQSRSLETAPLAGHARTDSEGQIGRKRSLIRPERNRIDRDHRNYHYHKHAAKMDVLPSSTGNDPLLENIETATERSGGSGSRTYESVSDATRVAGRSGGGEKTVDVNLTETDPNGRRGKRGKIHKEGKSSSKKKKVSQGEVRPPSIWNVYCAMITFWCPDFILRCCGKPTKAQQRAWREKMGLISIILIIMAIVGFLTFGFTATVCSSPPVRLRVNHVGGGYMIFHGVAYDLTQSHHPVVLGMPQRYDGLGANPLYDLPDEHYGGQDGSFLFQNVNGACKGLITRTANSKIITNSNGDLSWYYPCTTFNQDGSTKPNFTIPVINGKEVYNGYACHTTNPARDAFYNQMHGAADVYFSWDDIANSTRNLIVYSGSVLDLDILQWLDKTQVNYPTRFDTLRDRTSNVNQAIRGRDVTRLFQSSSDKAIAQCFEQIIKVGSVDTETVGCIASKVVLYCALVLILSVVGARFVLALIFQWFISRGYAAAKTSQSSDRRKRNRQIEDWSDDIYRAPIRLPGEMGSTVAGSDRLSKRSSFLPTTSRFSTVGMPDRVPANRRVPTTMASQGTSSALTRPESMYRQANDSRASFLRGDGFGGVSSIDGPGPAGFIHDSVVPQPPSDWMPFGFPLAHTICLVTAYSEGAEGIRTTLDSIAMTDYPNSHKVILVICDGVIKGKGEKISTPDVCLSMLKDHTHPPDTVPAFSYVAVASGSKRHNKAKVYSGFYDYGADSRIPQERQQRVPMMVIVKCGTKEEFDKPKPGNRGKRDSQIILMSFLQKVMFDERMTELEYEMFNGLWKVTGISPDYYEIVLMVDADTKVFPDSVTHMVSAMVKDPDIMGLCGETKIANKRASWVSAIQVFEYFISHHLAKSFESVFGGVTCLPGCFCMYRIKAPKGGDNYWVPILANPDIVEHYSENVVETLHEKNLYLLGEDRYLTTLMLRTFPKRKQVFVPQAVCKTTVPEQFSVLLSQRRRWINSTVHNLMELIMVRDLCGTFCFSMQFVVFIELIGTLVLPAAIAFTFYVIVISIVHSPPQIIPLVLLALVLGLPGLLIIVTAHSWSYVLWMFIYLLSLPIWNFVLPAYAFWKFDDFSWGETRKTDGESRKTKEEQAGEFDSSQITMKRWAEFERDKRSRSTAHWAQSRESVIDQNGGSWALPPPPGHGDYY